MTDVVMPWWGLLLMSALMVGCVALSAWFDHYSKARLKEATDYWRKSRDLWETIDTVPNERISKEGLRAMEGTRKSTRQAQSPATTSAPSLPSPPIRAE